ncbi:LemA family protein [Aquirufa antheringensis]|mgnify:FL=1|jgi:LemA protein|uniref:LemA family protein n=1 Tax=Aquirufa antheringensis TaxID=2516559 RepID=A0A4Q9BDY0_9BACT|nr:LemA family protein [Aquirufa antheringensis]MCE4217153.1 LemA family protein [Pseudarcicella sp. GAP-15]MCZ2484405.1 LemA family protein [Aquirufa antheringensis]MCZ2487726.1 LemA family protein [Aquirufa antheringensis]MCZ2489449.1 LemA family protein [Aquirufa antheringensis]TBH72583.1 LemA family protein [Aquirufa antheringensis]
MNKTVWIVLGVIALVIFWGVGSRNSMATSDQDVKAKWANVQSAYQRRADLIPNLVKTVQGVANFEKSTLTAVIEARASATQMKLDSKDLSPENLQKYQAAQSSLGGALSRLMVVAENYPQLKATENFSELQAQLEGTENRIKEERDNFNAAVQAYNTLIVTFPNSLIASFSGFAEKGFFQAEAGSEKAPEVNFDEKK